MELLTHLIAAIAGLLMGAAIAFVLLDSRRKAASDSLKRAEELTREFRQGSQQLERDKAACATDRLQLAAHKASLEEYQRENAMLKRDLLNVEITHRKLRHDGQIRDARQAELDQRARALADEYLADVVKWVGSAINANNFAACKQRLLRIIEGCRDMGFEITSDREAEIIDGLKEEFEHEVRRAIQREEQARVKAQIREEAAREREIERSLQAIQREKEMIQAALDRAMAEAGTAHSAEVESLKARLAEAEAKNQRTLSQAQLTRAGNIYVISNIGTFGTGVVKIGMTRRLDPLDRISELSDASVPFPFDVHMMIASNDAPALERDLHRQFHQQRVNKVNPRKEFFRTDVEDIRRFVEEHHGKVDYVAEAEALEYHQSLQLSDTDQQYIEQVFDDADRAIGSDSVED